MSELKIISACNMPSPDTSYFLTWSLDMIYQVEPELKEIATHALEKKGQRFYTKIDAYTEAKNKAECLIGWYARDPRLRSREAWDC